MPLKPQVEHKLMTFESDVRDGAPDNAYSRSNAFGSFTIFLTLNDVLNNFNEPTCEISKIQCSFLIKHRSNNKS